MGDTLEAGLLWPPEPNYCIEETVVDLRRQLADAVAETTGRYVWHSDYLADDIVGAIWPLIEAWGDARVAAARAETAAAIADLIERTKVDGADSDEALAMQATLDHCAALVRSVPGTTEGQSDG